MLADVFFPPLGESKKMPVLFGRGLVFTDEVIEEEKVEVVG